jgi:Golgi apparatus protein 1
MKSKALEDDCREKLQQRVEMFNNAAAVGHENLILSNCSLFYSHIHLKVMPQPESFQDLYETVSHSPQRRYFIIVMFTFVGFIFIIGLFFGRVTNKRYTLLKNK